MKIAIITTNCIQTQFYRARKHLSGTESIGGRAIHFLIALTLIMPNFAVFAGVVQAAPPLAGSEPRHGSRIERGEMGQTNVLEAISETIPSPQNINTSETAEQDPDKTIGYTSLAGALDGHLAKTPAVRSQFDAISTFTVTLSVSITAILPGNTYPLYWAVGGYEDDMQGALELVIHLPEGFAPQGSFGGAFDEAAGTMTMLLSAGEGVIEMSVSEMAKGPMFDLRADLFAAIRGPLNPNNSGSLASIDVAVDEDAVYPVLEIGGVITGLEGRIGVEIPGTAITESVDVRIRYSGEETRPPFTLSDRPFRLTARGRESGLDIHEFGDALTITYHYSDTEILGNEEDLAMFTFDTEREVWVQLPSEVDAENNVLTATTTHFSDFDVDINQWESARRPSLDGFQVSAFTGAANYGMSFWVPPGPGGLQPSVSLSYNSQTVDGGSAQTQAAWVGMGWSLSAGGFVQRNMNGTMKNTDDDTFSFVAGGVGGTLLPIPNADGNSKTTDFRTVEDSFWRIRYYHSDHPDFALQDSWQVWDKVGNTYYFDENATYLEVKNNCSSSVRTWKWGLTRMVNGFGQELTYKYFHDSKIYDPPCGGLTHNTDIGLYLNTIVYPNNRYRVKFNRSSRYDYHNQWASPSSQVFHERYFLDEIEIQHNDGGWQTVRAYDFIYTGGTQKADNEPCPAGIVYPNYDWWGSNKGCTLTLISIVEYGVGGSPSGAALPPTTFTYGDGLHLTSTANGYGGTIGFDYEDTPWNDVANVEEKREEQHFNHSTKLCVNEGMPKTWNRISEGGNIRCGIEAHNENPYHLYIHNAAAKHNVDLSFLQPGGRYLLDFKIGTFEDGVEVGLDFGSGVVGNTYQSLEIPNPQSLIVTLPDEAAHLWMYVSCEDCRVSDITMTQLPTFYRVDKKSAIDYFSGDDISVTYTYDEPAINDAIHSAFVAETADPDDLDTPPYASFRGHAVTQVTDEAGATSLTFFYQDDVFKGRERITLSGENVFTESFNAGGAWANFSSDWNKDGGGISFENFRGDSAMKIDPASGWRTVSRKEARTDGQAIVTQFYVDGNMQTQVVIGLDQDAPYRYWGVYIDSSRNAYARYDAGSGFSDNLLFSNLKDDTWYVLLQIIDNEEMYTLLWERETLGQVGEFRCDGSCPADSLVDASWKFEAAVTNGTLWLDAYTEMKLQTWSSQTYEVVQDHVTVQTTGAEPGRGGGDFDLSNISWVRLQSTAKLLFAFESEYRGTQTLYEYNAADQWGPDNEQYGNVTRVVEQEWQGNAWKDHRATRSYFYPNDSIGTYLVSLPAAANIFDCTGASGCDYDTSDVIASSRTRYDGLGTYNAAPSAGVPTASRTFVCWINGGGACVSDYPGGGAGMRFRDSVFEYDASGNQNRVTTFTGFGSDAALASSGPQVTETCFGSGSHPSCNSGLYHTYPGWVVNSLGHVTHFNFDEALGVVTSVVDPNNQVTSAVYDGFGRMIKIIKPGDTSGSPTVSLSYDDFGTPFFSTEVSQKMDETTSASIAKFYDGLGRLVQTQSLDVALDIAECGNGLCDVIIDFAYDAFGRLEKQTKPYAVQQGAGYRNPLAGQPGNVTHYDTLGRMISLVAPDGSAVLYNYGYLSSTVTDARSNATTTLFDIWGQTIKVEPPTGPRTAYGYDLLGHLTTVDILKEDNSFLAQTSISYDNTGQKIGMDDPDMGVWTYAYDGAGNLDSQTDAKSCTIDLMYDALNRLIEKEYLYPDCLVSSNIHFDYDTGPLGIGFRTGMTDGSGATAWQYDERGRLIEETKTVTGIGAFISRWTYNSADQIVTVQYPGGPAGQAGEVVAYGYHPQGGLESLAGANTYLDNASYDAAGRPTHYSQNPGKLETTFTYWDWDRSEGAGRLRYLKTGVPGGPSDEFQSLVYWHDPVGNIEKIRDFKLGGQEQIFTYDQINRLDSGKTQSGFQWGVYEQDFVYDTAGRLKSMDGEASTYIYQAPQTNSCPTPLSEAPFHAAVNNGNGSSYCYDFNGNMEKRTIGGDVYNLTHDAENRLTEVSGAENMTFTYDGDGARVSGTDGITTTVYLGGKYEYEIVDNTGTPVVILEVGKITDLTDIPQTVTLEHKFSNPVVIAQPLSHGGAEAAVVRVSDIKADKFTIQIVEPLGGTHGVPETVHFMVFESGSWTLPDGTQIQAGLVATGATVGKDVVNKWESVTFDTSFANDIAVLTQTQTDYAPGWLKTRQRNVSGASFEVAMEVRDGLTVQHDGEVIGWVAMDIGYGTWDGLKYEAGTTEAVVTHAWHRQGFATGMSSYPIFAAGIATYNGVDGAHLRYQLLKPGRVDVQVEEENENSGHAAEEVHFIVVQYQISNVTLTATGFGKRTRQYYSGMAMREAGRVYYLLTDHLGSTSEVVDMKMDVENRQDALISRVRYMPFGEQRYSSATPPTNQTYTGQYDEPGLGLMFYNARWYDPGLGRFIEADSIVPESGNPSAWDRYAYVVNNPLKYSDSSGHCWGIFAGVRKTKLYKQTCQNFDDALTIVKSEEASKKDKAIAGLYIGVEAVAHTAFVVGAAGIACGTVAPCATAVEPALGIGSAACADGDCTNEAEGLIYLLKPTVESAQLQTSLIDQLFRATDKIKGGTAGMLRQGTPQQISDHMDKAIHRLTQMTYILLKGGVGRGNKFTTLSQYDLDIVQSLYDDLLNAYNSAISKGY